MKTKMQAGKLIAAYIEDHMGRRLVLAQPDQSLGLVADRPLQIATTQTEAREVIRVLRELAQELPE